MGVFVESFKLKNQNQVSENCTPSENARSTTVYIYGIYIYMVQYGTYIYGMDVCMYIYGVYIYVCVCIYGIPYCQGFFEGEIFSGPLVIF